MADALFMAVCAFVLIVTALVLWRRRDPTAAHRSPGRFFLVVRIYRGIADHFTIRWTEWAMLFPTFGLWIVFSAYPDLFDESKSFTEMARWAEEATWSIVFGLAMVGRFAALAINGTFKGFEFSPHIRAGASLFGVLIWSQLSLGFLLSWLNDGGLPTAVIMYTLPVILELMNAWRSFLDVGKQFPVDR